MSASIPPYGGPKWTLTHEHGDVHLTVRQALTPDEADRLAAQILVASHEAREERAAIRESIEDSPVTPRCAQ